MGTYSELMPVAMEMLKSFNPERPFSPSPATIYRALSACALARSSTMTAI
jgi:hypothetical protein